MGLFKRRKDPTEEMTEPVDGTAKVEKIEVDYFPDVHVLGVTLHTGAESSMPKWVPATMTLTLSADRVPSTKVEWQGKCMTARRPFEGQTIPITVDRVDTHRLSIKWSEMPTADEALRLQKQRIDNETDKYAKEAKEGQRRADDTVEDARRFWRDLRDKGRVTDKQYEEAMRKLDDDLRRIDRE